MARVIGVSMLTNSHAAQLLGCFARLLFYKNSKLINREYFPHIATVLCLGVHKLIILPSQHITFY